MRLFRRRRAVPTGPQGPEPGAPPGAEGSRRKHYLVISTGMMGFVGGGILLLSVFSFWWTSQPEFCARCHVMDDYVGTWARSPHQDVNCELCHTPPGFFGFVGGKVAGLQVVANYVRGDFEDHSFNAAVPNASCLRCHEPILEEQYTSRETGVTVSHLHIIENGGKCMNCHSTVAHLEAVPIGSATFPTMDTCMKCHNGELAPTDCTLCHRQGPPGPSPPGEGGSEIER
jgi:nitrate/TMAO reductase-like tetraheme cytochrome c subunit